jgi:hypothetical protein
MDASLITATERPFTIKDSELSLVWIRALETPCMESYFNRWAKVAAGAKSLMATTSISGWSMRSLNRVLPMRPNPLIPIRILSMLELLL